MNNSFNLVKKHYITIATLKWFPFMKCVIFIYISVLFKSFSPIHEQTDE